MQLWLLRNLNSNCSKIHYTLHRPLCKPLYLVAIYTISHSPSLNHLNQLNKPLRQLQKARKMMSN